MTPSLLAINRLRVMRKGIAVYDQKFHRGVNIIRGENGSGKSTIADFIFYALGGEFENWKSAARECDEVQAEVLTRGGHLTIKRAVSTSQSKPDIFFGPIQLAAEQSLAGWTQYPIRRSDSRESFSQIMFRAIGIPEAQSQASANVTMHQILRLMYADQRTPSALLFRFESFDTPEIREAVGDLLCGLSVYEIYECELRLRDLRRELEEKARQLAALQAAQPVDEGLATPETIDKRLDALAAEAVKLQKEIAEVDDVVDQKQIASFLKERQSSAADLTKLRDAIRKTEQQRETLELETSDLVRFLSYLEETADKLPRAQASADIIGNIEFTHCPACLSTLSPVVDKEHCVVCGSKTDSDAQQSKYLQIKLDLEIQLRESRQLLEDKLGDRTRRDREYRNQVHQYQAALGAYAAKYDISISPRENFLAVRHRRLGEIERDRVHLVRTREIALQIAQLGNEKAKLQAEIAGLDDRRKSLERSSRTRRQKALSDVASIAKELLGKDLPRQDEFQQAATVAIRFGDNAMSVDGEMNFADSSSVILKNTAILSIFSAATLDDQFNHPRFVLLDNVEDKGMEMARSHNFQRLIVERSRAAVVEHQIIFTTSMINPDLDIDAYTIGPKYTHDHRTLELGD